MVLERAIFNITPGDEERFAAAVAEAHQYPRESRGFRSLRLLRGIESPSTFLLLIEWDSVEDHEEGFRAAPAFARWRELIGPYFAAPPAMEHYAPIIDSTT